MSNKQQKPQLKMPVVTGSFYWVRRYQGYDFEPAKCKERYGYKGLWFCFTNGSVMEVHSVWEFETLNYR